MLRRALDLRLDERNESREWVEVLRGLGELHGVEAMLQGHKLRLRSHLMAQAHVAVATAGVAVPPTLREKP